MVICAGTPGSGKTVLCQKLSRSDRDRDKKVGSNSDNHQVGDEAEEEGLELKTLPTVGVNHFQVDVSLRHAKKQKKKKKPGTGFELVTVRELGGELACAWTSYIQLDRDLIYVIDISDLTSVSNACIHLIKILEHLAVADSNEKARVLLVYSKTDRFSSEQEISARLVLVRSLLRLSYLRAWYESRVDFEELRFSAIESPIGGVAFVKNWLRKQQI